MFKLYLAMSFPDGWGGIKLTVESLVKIYGALSGGGVLLPGNKKGGGYSDMSAKQIKESVDYGYLDKNLKLRILISYHYYKDADLDEMFARYFTKPYPDVFADSGAYSAAQLGAEIKLRDYANWLKRWGHLFSVFANLDIIGDAHGSKLNQDQLEAWDLDALPIFHAGEPWGVLDEMLDKYPYVGLGGVAGMPVKGKGLMQLLIKCFRMAEGRAVYHGMGITNWKLMRNLPWYSVDSSSWGQGFRYGQVPLFDPRRGRMVKAQLGDKSSCFKFGYLFESMGLDPADFADRDRNDRAKLCAAGAISYMRAEAWLRKLHGEVEIPGKESGLKLHITDANADNLGKGQKGVNIHLAESRNDLGDVRNVENHLKNT